jgi:hypothetical protein
LPGKFPQKLEQDAARFQAICGELERHGKVLLTMRSKESIENHRAEKKVICVTITYVEKDQNDTATVLD